MRNDELIYRHDALKAACEGFCVPGPFCPDGYCKQLDKLKAVPAVGAKRERGHWEEVNDAYNRIAGRCSVCGWEAHLYEDDVVGMNYCPNCGSRLKV